MHFPSGVKRKGTPTSFTEILQELARLTRRFELAGELISFFSREIFAAASHESKNSWTLAQWGQVVLQ